MSAGRKPALPCSLWAAVPGALSAPLSSQTLVSAVVALTCKFLLISLAAIWCCVVAFPPFYYVTDPYTGLLNCYFSCQDK